MAPLTLFAALLLAVPALGDTARDLAKSEFKKAQAEDEPKTPEGKKSA